MHKHSLLRTVVRESIAPAAVHAAKRAREREQQTDQGPQRKKKKRSAADDSVRNRHASEEATYDATGMVGPHMAKKLLDAMGSMDLDQLKTQYPPTYNDRSVSTWTGKRPKGIIITARKALVRAMLRARDAGEDPVAFISKVIDQTSERAQSDVEHAKRRVA